MPENIEMTSKINTIDLLIINLTKYVAAYRKSYKLCGRIDVGLKITGGLFGCAAILTLVPTMPILLAIAGAMPAGITIVSQKTRFAEKRASYKAQHRKMKELLSYVHKLSAQITEEENEKQLIRDVFWRILENEKEANFITPLEMYMKKFKLNGYV